MSEPLILPTHQLQRGEAPLLISIPHLGTELPEAWTAGFSPEARRLIDTDWHLDRLYDFAAGLGITVLGARISRYVIDLNRPASGESLYPGQTTTGLCPTETFEGVPLYRPGAEPDDAERARRIQACWQPYHAALQDELARLRARHPQVLLWEAHSIASQRPRLFPGRLPDLNFGTNDGKSCAPALLDAVLAALPSPGPGTPSHVVNGRFKGGYITRHYGQPSSGVHAIQLEMSQALYVEEVPPFRFHDGARATQALLKGLLGAALATLG
ncbi:N-formylglutamate deformylase [Aquariibacter albus]|uniref:N-formylglutamate deformylase n=1 Tax=Aquariibacter albus TaxID=2759899 RepID=A0A839HLF3_9BURK|nr:N-formylglutamate deformylase [Aquariibacter albus]MBB1160368.1 N-formylglutamate deformylase [Aquariibacter albus]